MNSLKRNLEIAFPDKKIRNISRNLKKRPAYIWLAYLHYYKWKIIDDSVIGYYYIKSAKPQVIIVNKTKLLWIDKLSPKKDKRTFTPQCLKKFFDETIECVVCYNQLEDTDTYRPLHLCWQCCSYMCPDCKKNWISNKCTVCKSEIVKEKRYMLSIYEFIEAITDGSLQFS